MGLEEVIRKLKIMLTRIILILLISIALIGCMETDARVLQLEADNAQLEQDIMLLVDSIDSLVTVKNLEIVNLNATIQLKQNSFDSLMVLWNNQLSDTTYLNTLKERLILILNKSNPSVN